MTKPHTRSTRPPRRRQRRPRRWWPAAVLIGVVAAASLVIAISAHKQATPQNGRVGLSAPAPDGPFTTTGGTTASVRAFRGQPTLLWFVTTFCGSCQAGTQAMAQHINQFAAAHVKVVELELADNLGGGGPDIATFARTNTNTTSLTNPDWVWGTASQQLTTTYDPDSYLDIYYLIDSSGRIVYANSSPGATMGALLAHVRTLPS